MPSKKAKSRAGKPKKTASSERKTLRRSSRSSKKSASTSQQLQQHVLFLPLLTLTFVLWVVYRSLLPFPVWFDETIAKAIFFGFPVWIYITTSQSKSIMDTFAPGKLYPGLLLGIAIGGVFGFISSFLGILQRGVVIQAAPLFVSNSFWWEFFLAMMTGVWETLFFFSFVMTVILEKFKKWPFLNQLLVTALIFSLFHLPNSFLRYGDYGWWILMSQVIILFFFAIGQGLIFSRWRNFYALVMSHAIWGMVLLVHISRGF